MIAQLAIEEGNFPTTKFLVIIFFCYLVRIGIQMATMLNGREKSCVGRIGIIGGSGMAQSDLLKEDGCATFDTPFGAPSDGKVLMGTISGVPCAVVVRHGKRHDVMPSDVNYRANLYG